jgi:hypothetical protein
MTKFVVKPLRWDTGFMIVPNEFARDRSISDFTRTVILDVCSHNEEWKTNVATIMHNFKVGRDKAKSVLIEGQKAGYVHSHTIRAANGRMQETVYIFSTSKAELAKFVQESDHLLKNQLLVDQELVDQSLAQPLTAVDTQLNKERELKKDEPKANQEFAGCVEAEAQFPERPDLGSQHLKHQAPEPSSLAKQRAKPAKGSEEFEAAWKAYKAASSRSPGSRPLAIAQFNKLRPDEQKLVLGAIEKYRADCEAAKFGNGDHRHMADMHRFFTNFFAQFAEPEDPAEQEETQIKAVALDLYEGTPKRSTQWWPNFQAIPNRIVQLAQDFISDEGWEPLPSY